MRIKTRFAFFLYIVKDSHKDTGIQLKNSVLKQAKMLTIYQRKIRDTKNQLLCCCKYCKLIKQYLNFRFRK